MQRQIARKLTITAEWLSERIGEKSSGVTPYEDSSK